MNEITKAKRMLWLFGIFKIPLIGYVNPKIIEFTDTRMVIRIKLRRRTRNHLGSMYFGALGIGADLAGAFQAFSIADKKKRKISLAFKDFQANFLKRPEGDVFFVSDAGGQIAELMDETILTKQRVTQSIHVNAYINYPENPELVAEFTLGLSVKDKG
ncbi:MAG: acyl-coenzyme A thioesterase PaaI-like protein [Salibacteraceae bacterium]|jgi:acyl-coenzyme A thioesterase PaaI-like protein